MQQSTQKRRSILTYKHLLEHLTQAATEIHTDTETVNRKVGAQQKPESQHGSRRERQQNHTLGARTETRALESAGENRTKRSDLARCTRERRDRREQ
jgi:hypothetical protein